MNSYGRLRFVFSGFLSISPLFVQSLFLVRPSPFHLLGGFNGVNYHPREGGHLWPSEFFHRCGRVPLWPHRVTDASLKLCLTRVGVG